MRASFLCVCQFQSFIHCHSIHDVEYVFTLVGIYQRVCAQLFLLVVLDSITAITCFFLNWFSEYVLIHPGQVRSLDATGLV